MTYRAVNEQVVDHLKVKSGASRLDLVEAFKAGLLSPEQVNDLVDAIRPSNSIPTIDAGGGHFQLHADSIQTTYASGGNLTASLTGPSRQLSRETVAEILNQKGTTSMEITVPPVTLTERFYASNEDRQRAALSDEFIDHATYEEAVQAGVIASRGRPGTTFVVKKYLVVVDPTATVDPSA
jgi:hypothetical protein